MLTAFMTPTQSSKRRRSFHLGPAVGYFLLPLMVFAFTSIPGVNALTPFLALLSAAVLLAIRFVPKAPRSLRSVMWAVLVLSLVGATGWFFSPFFFALYLMGIALGFLYTPLVAITFTLSLVTMFAFSVGEVNPTADFLTLVSLFSVIPITIALRKSYLLVQQEHKDILILENSERGGAGVTSLDAILQNRVSRIGILLRQPLTYMKQGLSLLAEGKLTENEYPDVLRRMQRAADDLFTLVKEFESGATKHILLGRKAPPRSEERP